MLEPLLGSKSIERVLIFIQAREQGYATEIARFFKADLYAIQLQLDKLELAGVLESHRVGKTRVFTFNPQYPLFNELKSLLERALFLYPVELKEELILGRSRHQP